MLELSIALVIIAGIAAYVILTINSREHSIQSTINNDTVQAALSDAKDELSKSFDSRINKIFEKHQLLQSEMESLRLQIAIKR
jgi:hypothetical protein